MSTFKCSWSKVMPVRARQGYKTRPTPPHPPSAPPSAARSADALRRTRRLPPRSQAASLTCSRRRALPSPTASRSSAPGGQRRPLHNNFLRLRRNASVTRLLHGTYFRGGREEQSAPPPFHPGPRRRPTVCGSAESKSRVVWCCVVCVPRPKRVYYYFNFLNYGRYCRYGR